MKLLTTNDVIEILQKQDPNGECVVYFNVYDESSNDDVVFAYGEVEDIDITIKESYQTLDGDRKVIRIGLRLAFNDLT